VAVLSPSGRSPARFPGPFELGLRRLRDELELQPVEYPTTRAAEAPPAERADDIHTAFADPEIAAIIASIGGEDEMKVLAHLDPRILADNPKPFFGYSDNTNLHLFLWNLGIVSYHGGAVMVQLARPVTMHPTTRRSLEHAFFSRGTYVLDPVAEYSDEERDWSDEEALSIEPPSFASNGWTWYGARTKISGRAWGGSLEVVDLHLRANRYLLGSEAYDGCVLFLETSEEMRPARYVYRVLMGMGERGLLQRFAAVVWARPKAWSFEQPNRGAAKAHFVEAQRDAVLAAVADYHPDVPLVFGVDFGHTEPQYVIPSGGMITVDAAAQRIAVDY
jgi:muramoyltetrapeptide carboxypeptidase LdcA involved in peptidoglycan recycling